MQEKMGEKIKKNFHFSSFFGNILVKFSHSIHKKEILPLFMQN